MSESSKSLELLKEKLWRLSERVREIENQADRSLEENYNLEQHRSLLEKKASLLSSLPEEAEPYLDQIQEKTSEAVRNRLDIFARNAEQALGVGSVFFMRQLLYPEDYREGQDNDLESFIRSL